MFNALTTDYLYFLVIITFSYLITYYLRLDDEFQKEILNTVIMQSASFIFFLLFIFISKELTYGSETFEIRYFLLAINGFTILTWTLYFLALKGFWITSVRKNNVVSKIFILIAVIFAAVVFFIVDFNSNTILITYGYKLLLPLNLLVLLSVLFEVPKKKIKDLSKYRKVQDKMDRFYNKSIFILLILIVLIPVIILTLG